MPKRSATTAWQGTLEQGSGRVTLQSSKIATYDVSFPARAADEAGGITSPEELIAAAHSACYAMQFSALAAEAGGVPVTLSVNAEVSLEADPAGGFRIGGIVLQVSGSVEGLDAGGFERVAQQAKDTCPVSKALSAVPITLRVES